MPSLLGGSDSAGPSVLGAFTSSLVACRSRPSALVLGAGLVTPALAEPAGDLQTNATPAARGIRSRKRCPDDRLRDRD
jgi:hypothetical protein